MSGITLPDYYTDDLYYSEPEEVIDFKNDCKRIVSLNEIQKLVTKFYYDFIIQDIGQGMINISEIIFCFDTTSLTKLTMYDVTHNDFIIILYLLVKLIGYKNIAISKYKIIIDKLIKLINMTDYYKSTDDDRNINLYCLSKLIKKLYKMNKLLYSYDFISNILRKDYIIDKESNNFKYKLFKCYISLYGVLNRYYYKLVITDNVCYVDNLSKKHINNDDGNYNYNKELNKMNKNIVELHKITTKAYSLVNYFNPIDGFGYDQTLLTIEYIIDYCEMYITDTVVRCCLPLSEYQITSYIIEFKTLFEKQNPNTLFYKIFATMLEIYYSSYNDYQDKQTQLTANNNLVVLYKIYKQNYPEDFNDTINKLQIDYTEALKMFMMMNSL